MSEHSLFAAPEIDEKPLAGAFARVAVERGIDALDAPPGLTYACGAVLPHLGERVLVPLGKGGKLTPGVVIEIGGAELAAGLAASKIKAIAQLTGAILPPTLLALGRWMSDYYLCPLGMALSAIMPASVKAGIGKRRVEMFERGAALVEGGRSEETSVEETSGGSPMPRLKPAAKKLWQLVLSLPASEFPLPAKALLERAGVKSAGAVKELVSAGLLTSRSSEEVHAGAIQNADALAWARPHALSSEQVAAVEGIVATIGTFHPHLLRGVTSSGKTEVYLSVIEAVLARGKTAIVLVPEISLTPQTAARFVNRLGAASVAVLHSGLTAAQRHKEWARAASGGAQVVVGARSAVFAPLANLGVIVVDEEHDASYKQDRLPRYQGRDVAIKRAHLEQCAVVLGSATPSLESWGAASAQPPRYSLWHLTTRAAGATMPRVQVVDMRSERISRGKEGRDLSQHLIGPTLEKHIEAALQSNAQVLLLLNRRGFASYISCQAAGCGFILSCDHCDCNLVLHKHEGLPLGGFVRCHHCDAQQLVPKVCPACGHRLNLFSGGTQRLEVELTQKFGSLGLVEGVSMVRVDSDSMQSSRDYFEVLTRFAAGEIRLLLGTQMIAKGLDFPNVRLVGVIDADMSLNIPDFRSAERTFQLVAQVSGRAGRGDKPGLVIVQTANPQNPAIQLAAKHDYITFADRELAIRVGANLPPKSRLARVVCRDKSAEKAENGARVIASALQAAAPPQVGIRGPLPCPVTRIAGQFRFGVDVLAPSAKVMHEVLNTLRIKEMLKSDATTAVDVDPVALM